MTMPKIHTNGSDSRSYANQSKPATTSNFVDTPPEVIEAEQAVIGCLLFSRRQTVDELISFGVAPEMFYRQAHQYLYVAALYLSQKGQRIDALTMKNRLIEMGVYDGIGGAAYLMACGESVVTTANVLSYAAIVQNHYARRMLHKEAMSLSALAQDFDGDAKDLYAIADGNLQEAMRSCLPKTAGAEDNASGIREALEGVGQGVFCGLQSIDNLLWGVMGGEMMILAARPGRGKCLGKGTPVLLQDGSVKPVEEIRVCDSLMGPDGSGRRVVSLGNGYGPLYKVTPCKGDSYVVNDSHILSLRMNKNMEGHKYGDIVNISIGDYMKSSSTFKSRAKGWRGVPDFPEEYLPLDPYFLGLWLGDGTLGHVSISKPDAEIRDFMSRFASSNDLFMKEYNNKSCPTYRITSGIRGGFRSGDNSVLETMQGLGVINDKHIPMCYKHNSRENRLELLAGLLDSDGYRRDESGYEIVTKSDRLCEDYLWLARSLGFSAYKHRTTKGIKSTGFSGIYWRISIYGNTTDIPLKIPRKRALHDTLSKDVTNVGITVEPCGDGEWYGFEIDGDHLFMLGDFTVTHNTTLALQMARYAADVQEEWALFYSFEMSRRELFCKLLATDARVDSMKFRKGPDAFTEEERERIAEASESLSKSRMTIADTRGMTLYALRSHIRSQVRKHGKGIVFVDYLQIVAPDKAGFSRENEVSTIARGLKETAREMDIPLVALAQLSRKVDDRIDQTPNMGDLRESGTIEQEADIIAFLASRGEKDMLLCPTDVIIEKMRGGGTGEASILFDKQHGSFTEVSKSEEYAKW